jgi:hypothetical protein
MYLSPKRSDVESHAFSTLSFEVSGAAGSMAVSQAISAAELERMMRLQDVTLKWASASL